STIGSTDSSSATIQVNSLQVGAVSVSGTLTEGSWVAAAATFTPTGRQTYKCKVDYGDGTGAQTGTISGTTCKGPSHKYGRPGSFTITVTVTGSKGNAGSSTRAVEIANVMPVVTATLPTAAKVGTSVTLSASFTDPGTTETYQVIVDWGDGTRVPIQLGHGRSFTASHTYTRAGGYGVVVEVSDDQMAHVVTAASGIAVYDPARTLSGSGTFASPAGACTFSSKCAGASTATFSVTASYARGATKPTATFTFSAAGISFTATSFEWYTVMNGVGVLHGSGKLNGLSGYRFDVYTVDGAPDKVLVNIFDSNGNSIYSNNDYTPLKTGWIVMR
ncbi:MAG: PKD domain-containing protein, partial [Candidatus Limnocylindrales bacterium]